MKVPLWNLRTTVQYPARDKTGQRICHVVVNSHSLRSARGALGCCPSPLEGLPQTHTHSRFPGKCHRQHGRPRDRHAIHSYRYGVCGVGRCRRRSDVGVRHDHQGGSRDDGPAAAARRYRSVRGWPEGGGVTMAATTTTTQNSAKNGVFWLVLLASAILEAVWATALGLSNGFTQLIPTLVF